MNQLFVLGAYWPCRRESADQCGNRIRKFLGGLRECDSIFEQWYEKGRSKNRAYENRVDIDDNEYVKNLLNRGRRRIDIGDDVTNDLGYSIGLWNGATEDRAVGLSISCGICHNDPKTDLYNRVVLDLPRNLGELHLTECMAHILAIAVKTWEPAWVCVISRSMMLARGMRSGSDWMLFTPRKIDYVPSPSSVIPLQGVGTIVVVRPSPPSEYGSQKEIDHIERINKIVKEQGQ